MDKETLSNYGWIVIAVLVLVVMIALATPFGSYISEAVQSTTKGLFDVNKSALDSTGLINIDNQEFDVPDMNHGAGESEGSGEIPVTPSYNHNAPELHPTNIDLDGTGRTTPQDGDTYKYGDYEYKYNFYYSATGKWTKQTSQNGWGVRVVDKSKTSYGAILESINGEPITNMRATFRGTSIVTAPAIPSGVTSLCETFYRCRSLLAAPDLSNCTQLADMSMAFFECTSLTTVPVIPINVENMQSTFEGCTALTGTIKVDTTKLIVCSNCFGYTTENITLTGTSPYLTQLAASATFSNVTVQ